MVAFACRPGRGSEPGAGWAMARGAARRGHEVTLLTQRRNRDGIEAARARHPVLAAHLHPVYLGLPAPVMRAWDRWSLRGLPVYAMAWQWSAGRVARRLQREAPFDVAHHVTPSSDWLASGLAGIAGLPLVWGPVGGAERVPGACRRWLGPAGRARDRAHRVVAGALRATAGRRTREHASLVVAQNRQEADQLQRRAGGPPVLVRHHVALVDPPRPAGATDPDRPGDPVGGAPKRAVFAGRLVAWKGLRLALAALAQPAAAGWELHVYGDGPERRAVARAVQRLGLADRVTLHGWCPRPEVRAAMAGADALLFPSLRDAAGWVVAEALALGCPVVCLAGTGPAELLSRGGGIAVTPSSRTEADLAAALAAVADVPPATAPWDDADLGALLTAWYQRARREPDAPVGGPPDP